MVIFDVVKVNAVCHKYELIGEVQYIWKHEVSKLPFRAI